MSTHRASLQLNFAATRQLDHRITFARSTLGTYFDVKGILKTAAINEPRFEHDYLTCESQGLLIEEQRTNAALYCRDLTNAAWTKASATAALSQTGIDGAASSASLLTAASVNATCLQAVTLASSARLQSAYIKRVTGSGAIYMTQDNGATWADITAQINSASYTRISLNAQTLTNPIFGFKLAASGDAIAVDYVQNESGAFATSPILTAGTAVTRNADNATITSANLAEFNNANECSIIADVVLKGSAVQSAVNKVVWSLRKISNGDQAVALMSTNADRATALGYNGGVYQVIAYNAVLGLGQHKIAVGLKTGSLAIAADNSNVGTSTLFIMPVADVFEIGSSASSSYLCGCIASLGMYTKQLSNANLQALSVNS